jgi:hypothetical protein
MAKPRQFSWNHMPWKFSYSMAGLSQCREGRVTKALLQCTGRRVTVIFFAGQRRKSNREPFSGP